MDQGFDNGTDLETNESLVRPAKRRKLGDDHAVPGCSVPDDQDRHRAWTTRGRKGKDTNSSASWRPRHIYRVATKRLLGMWDNQVQGSTPLRGLVHYKKDTKRAEWANWRTWPHLGMATDLGSDCVCATNCAIYHFELNFTRTPDFDHGAQRSLIDTLKNAGLYEFFLLMVVSWNLPNGPANNDYRYHQITEACDHLGRKHTSKTCVPQLFTRAFVLKLV